MRCNCEVPTEECPLCVLYKNDKEHFNQRLDSLCDKVKLNKKLLTGLVLLLLGGEVVIEKLL